MSMCLPNVNDSSCAVSLDQPVDVDLHRLQRLLPCKGKQARCQPRAAIGSIADQLRHRGELRLVLDTVSEDFDRPRDDGEHIVEFVRDAAGELADRFHLLRLDQLLLGKTLLADVPHEIVEDIAVAAAKRRGRDLDREFASVPVHRACLEPDAGGHPQFFADHFLSPLPVRIAHPFRHQQIHHIGADRLFPGPPGQGFRLRPPLENDAVEISLKEGIERRLDDPWALRSLSTSAWRRRLPAPFPRRGLRISTLQSSERLIAQAAPRLRRPPANAPNNALGPAAPK
jgi:hypothetical protein